MWRTACQVVLVLRHSSKIPVSTLNWGCGLSGVLQGLHTCMGLIKILWFSPNSQQVNHLSQDNAVKWKCVCPHPPLIQNVDGTTLHLWQLGNTGQNPSHIDLKRDTQLNCQILKDSDPKRGRIHSVSPPSLAPTCFFGHYVGSHDWQFHDHFPWQPKGHKWCVVRVKPVVLPVTSPK